MKKLLLALLCISCTLFAKPYEAQDFSNLLGMKGFSDDTLKMHFKLYQGYVNNTNLLFELMNDLSEQGKEKSIQFGALKQRLGFEFDGMRLHELYFSNLGGKDSTIDKKGALYKKLVQDYGSYAKWEENFKNTGLIRGIGWVVAYLDPEQGRIINMWVSEHQVNNIPGANPLLVMDVWEHAYLLDYGLDRAAYINAFFENIDWKVVSKRYGK